FEFVRHALQSCREFASDCFHLLLAASRIAGCPIELPQTVQDRASDTMLGISREENASCGIVLPRGSEKAGNAAVDQVIQINVEGHLRVNASRNRLHRRKVL